MSDDLIEYVELPASVPLPATLIVRQFKRDERGQRLIVGEETYTRGVTVSPPDPDDVRLDALDHHAGWCSCAARGWLTDKE